MKYIPISILLISLLPLINCTNDVSTRASISSSSNESTSSFTTTLTYTNDIKSLLDTKCVACHMGQHTSFNEYSNIVNKSTTIARYVESGYMPKTGGGITLSDTEKQNILDWIRGGAPE